MVTLEVSEDEAYLVLMFAQSVLCDESAPVSDRYLCAELFHKANRKLEYPVDGRGMTA
jgi:hypothetical protein